MDNLNDAVEKKLKRLEKLREKVDQGEYKKVRYVIVKITTTSNPCYMFDLSGSFAGDEISAYYSAKSHQYPTKESALSNLKSVIDDWR